MSGLIYFYFPIDFSLVLFPGATWPRQRRETTQEINAEVAMAASALSN